MRIRAILAFLLCIPVLTSATTRRVPADFPTIQAAVNASMSGDIVEVSGGTYTQTLTIANKSIALTSAPGTGEVTLKPTSYFTLEIKGSTNQSEIKGFTFAGPVSNAILISGQAAPLIRNCIIHHCSSEAIYITDGSPEISRCVFYGNTGISCIGVYDGYGTTKIYNNTFDRNARGFYSLLSTTIAENNIVFKSRDYGMFGAYAKNDYNDIFGNGADYEGGSSAGSHSLSLDPQFVDTAAHDYQLKAGSPCIDAGDPDPKFNDIDGSRSDMGSGPFLTGELPLAVALRVTPGVPPAVTSPNFTVHWHYFDSLGRSQLSYEIEVGMDRDWTTAELWAPGVVTSTDTFAVYGGVPPIDGQSCYLRIRLANSLKWGDWVEYSFYCHFNPVLRVPSAYSTIQSAIDAAITGDTVLVAPGVYTENISFGGHRVRLMSEGGASTTTIRALSLGSSTVKFVTGEDSLSVIDGFTVKSVGNGDAIFCQSSRPIIQNCDLTEDTPIDGPTYGVRLQSAVPIIRHNRIFGQRYGIRGLNCSGTEIAFNEIFQQSSSNESYGIWMDGASFNCIVHHNVVRDIVGPGSTALGMAIDGRYARIHNNTIVRNRIGLRASVSTVDTVFNNIIAFNQSTGFSAGYAWYDYNDVFQNGGGNGPGPHGIALDPEFVDAANLDFSLKSSSPCIDAGTPDTMYNDPDGTRGDMGAVFKLRAGAPIVTKLSILPGTKLIVFDPTPTFYWHFYDAPANSQAGYEIEVGTSHDWSNAEYWATGQVMSLDTAVVYGGLTLVADTKYALRIRLFNGTSWGDWLEWDFGTRFGGPWRVPVHAGRISTLVSLAATGDSIIVAPGTYSDNFSFQGKALIVTSDSGYQQTIIQPLTLGIPVVEFTNSEGRSSILEKLSIRGARNAVGIQITNASPTIRNCEVTDNQDANGGIRMTGGGPHIDGCRIHHNIATSPGAAIAGTISAPTEIAHNFIYENGGAGGGGILISPNASLDIHHNIVYRNQGIAAGIGLSYGSGNIRNNTIVSNSWGIQTTSSSAHIFNNIVINSYNDAISSGSAYIDFNDTWGNGRDLTSGGGNIQSNPLIADTMNFDFSLLPESPCVDAGDPNPMYFDPDGSRSDMGALPRDQTGLARVVALTLPNENLARVAAAHPIMSWSSIFPGGSQQQAFEIQMGRDQDWDWVDLWEPGPITSTDTSVQYAGTTPLRDGMQVYMRLRVFDGTLWTSWHNLSFHMDNRPAIPELSFPGDTALVLVNKPQVGAMVGTDKDGDEQSLIFELYRDSSLLNIRATSPLYTGTAGSMVLWTVPTPLLENYRYWWRVKSFDGYLYSDWSSPRSFWINQLSENPTVPVLTSPIEQAEGPEYDLTPAFVWGEGDDPDPKDTVRYAVQISLNDTFTLAFTYPDLLTKTFVENDSLPVSIHFWWRVMATDREGHSAMSLSGQFTTYSPGDVDHSGYPDLADLALMIDYLYISRTPFSPLWAGDVDGDCSVDIADITRLIDYLYLTYYPLEAGCGVSASTGQQFLKKLGAEIKRERGKLPVPKAASKPTVLAPTQ